MVFEIDHFKKPSVLRLLFPLLIAVLLPKSKATLVNKVVLLWSLSVSFEKVKKLLLINQQAIKTCIFSAPRNELPPFFSRVFVTAAKLGIEWKARKVPLSGLESRPPHLGPALSFAHYRPGGEFSKAKTIILALKSILVTFTTVWGDVSFSLQAAANNMAQNWKTGGRTLLTFRDLFKSLPLCKRHKNMRR